MLSLLRSRHSQRACAVTLLEVVIALSIGATLTAVLATTHLASVKAQRRSEAATRDLALRSGLADQFEADLRHVVTWRVPPDQAITWPSERDILVRLLSVCPTFDSEEMFRRTLPCRIEYRLSRVSGGDGHCLVRRVWDLTENAPDPAEYTVAEGCLSARIDAWDGENWSIPQADRNPVEVLPRAVRLQCTWPDVEPVTRIVILRDDDKKRGMSSP